MADKFKKWFIRKWEPSDILFSIYLVAFFTFGTFLFTLRVEHIEGVAMIFAFGMSGLFLVCAILTLIRMNIEPKDTRLDTLIGSITKLDAKIDKLTENSIDKNTIIKLESAIKELTQEIKNRKSQFKEALQEDRDNSEQRR
jgi:hypothetical protein